MWGEEARGSFENSAVWWGNMGGGLRPWEGNEEDGPDLSRSSMVCVSVCVCVKPLTAVLLLRDGADNIAGVHEPQELRRTSKQERLDDSAV